ncbi:MAG: hypothetical protein Q9157_007438 [Trypethelium eluteriae]
MSRKDLIHNLQEYNLEDPVGALPNVFNGLRRIDAGRDPKFNLWAQDLEKQHAYIVETVLASLEDAKNRNTLLGALRDSFRTNYALRRQVCLAMISRKGATSDKVGRRSAAQTVVTQLRGDYKSGLKTDVEIWYRARRLWETPKNVRNTMPVEEFPKQWQELDNRMNHDEVESKVRNLVKDFDTAEAIAQKSSYAEARTSFRTNSEQRQSVIEPFVEELWFRRRGVGRAYGDSFFGSEDEPGGLAKIAQEPQYGQDGAPTTTGGVRASLHMQASAGSNPQAESSWQQQLAPATTSSQTQRMGQRPSPPGSSGGQPSRPATAGGILPAQEPRRQPEGQQQGQARQEWLPKLQAQMASSHAYLAHQQARSQKEQQHWTAQHENTRTNLERATSEEHRLQTEQDRWARRAADEQQQHAQREEQFRRQREQLEQQRQQIGQQRHQIEQQRRQLEQRHQQVEQRHQQIEQRHQQVEQQRQQVEQQRRQVEREAKEEHERFDRQARQTRQARENFARQAKQVREEHRRREEANTHAEGEEGHRKRLNQCWTETKAISERVKASIDQEIKAPNDPSVLAVLGEFPKKGTEDQPGMPMQKRLESAQCELQDWLSFERNLNAQLAVHKTDPANRPAAIERAQESAQQRRAEQAMRSPSQQPVVAGPSSTPGKGKGKRRADE